MLTRVTGHTGGFRGSVPVGGLLSVRGSGMAPRVVESYPMCCGSRSHRVWLTDPVGARPTGGRPSHGRSFCGTSRGLPEPRKRSRSIAQDLWGLWMRENSPAGPSKTSGVLPQAWTTPQVRARLAGYSRRPKLPRRSLSRGGLSRCSGRTLARGPWPSVAHTTPQDAGYSRRPGLPRRSE